jgi:hypothetical protein
MLTGEGCRYEMVRISSPEQEQGLHQQHLHQYFRPKQEIATATLDVASDWADGEKLVVPKTWGVDVFRQQMFYI